MFPLVSILLPCYNAEKYLNYSLDSVLMQDYKNLEIICINDGSTDTTLSILNSYKIQDKRIIVVDNESNIGLIQSLNKGLKLVKGEYFARMDADDFSTPDRISEQLKFMQDNKNIDLVSSAYNYFYDDGKKEAYVSPIAIKSGSLKFLSIFCTPLTHASVLGKSSLIHSGLYKYDLSFPYAEDFELFSRLAYSNVKLSMIEKSLYFVRLHSGSVSAKYHDIQIQTNIKIIHRNIKNIPLIEHFDDQIAGLLACKINTLISLKQIKHAFSIFDKCLATVNSELGREEQAEIGAYMSLHKLNILIQANKMRFRALGGKNYSFFIQSLLLLKLHQFKLIFRKILP
jgi:glycosyltransferase involved in cell wall biosynthesis